MYVQSFGHASKQTTNGVATASRKLKRYTQHEVLVTPEYAAQLLAMSAGNRTLDKKNLKYWSELMRSGKWMNNGQNITISVPTPERPNGTLLDGHTRLTACTIAGVPFETDIKWNVPVEAMDSMDSGNPRTQKNHAEIYGIADSKNVSAVFNKYHAYTNKYSQSQDKPHKQEAKVLMREWYYANPYADTSLVRKTNHIMNGAMAQTAYIIIREAGCKAAYVDEFFDSLIKGAGLLDGNPVLTLRNALTRNDVKMLAMSTFSQHRYIAMIIRMFNHWVNGKPCAKLYPPQSGDFVQPIIPAHARVNS